MGHHPSQGPSADQDSHHLDPDTSSRCGPQHSPGSLRATVVGAEHRAAAAGAHHCPQGAPWRALQPRSVSGEGHSLPLWMQAASPPGLVAPAPGTTDVLGVCISPPLVRRTQRSSHDRGPDTCCWVLLFHTFNEKPRKHTYTNVHSGIIRKGQNVGKNQMSIN